MRGRRWVVIGTMLFAGAAAAQDRTLQPSKLTLTVPQGWEVMSERYRDFLHYESSEDSEPRAIEVSFEREQTTCKAWRATGGKKEKPAYWPKKAKTPLFTVRADGKIRQTGCLADTPTGALIAELETTTEDPKYKPSAIDQAMLRDALAAALAGALAPPAVKPPEPTAASSGPPGTQAPSRMPALDKPDFMKGGTKVTIPRLELTLKLPKGESWIVGARGETKLERAAATYDPAVAPLSVGVFAIVSRTCQEWRVDTSTSAVMSFVEKPAYLPTPFKIGAFAYTLGTATQVSTCLDTKVGALGIAFEYGGALDDGADVALVKSLLDAIAAGASTHVRPTFPGSVVAPGGSKADASAATITLPKATTWRVTNGTIERFDNDRYFSLASMSRPTTCDSKTATEQPFLPAGVKGVVEAKPWGTTVAKVCIQTTRAIELTLAYDGAIREADRPLIKALVEAFSVKKPPPRS